MTARIILALIVVSSLWACGGDSVATPEQPSLERGLHEVGTMTRPRYEHSATLLKSGKVLIAGGNAEIPPAEGGVFRPDGLISAEIFDPETGTSTPTGSLSVSRYGDHGILLPDGRVVIVPRYGRFPIEMYDPSSGRFGAVAEVPANASIATATLLPSGKFFVTTRGAFFTGVFDLPARTFHSIVGMGYNRIGHTSTLLKDGRVLIVGGLRGRPEDGMVGRNLIYDPTSGTLSEAGELDFDRMNHEAVLLQDGRVLIVGGHAADGSVVHTAETYDPATSEFSPAGTSPVFPIAARLLPSGNVLLIHEPTGNIAIYNPATHEFSSTGHRIGPHRSFVTVTLLEDGRVMVAGGLFWKSDDSTDEHAPLRQEISDQILVFTP